MLESVLSVYRLFEAIVRSHLSKLTLQSSLHDPSAAGSAGMCARLAPDGTQLCYVMLGFPQAWRCVLRCLDVPSVPHVKLYCLWYYGNTVIGLK